MLYVAMYEFYAKIISDSLIIQTVVYVRMQDFKI